MASSRACRCTRRNMTRSSGTISPSLMALRAPPCDLTSGRSRCSSRMSFCGAWCAKSSRSISASPRGAAPDAMRASQIIHRLYSVKRERARAQNAARGGADRARGSGSRRLGVENESGGCATGIETRTGRDGGGRGPALRHVSHRITWLLVDQSRLKRGVCKSESSAVSCVWNKWLPCNMNLRTQRHDRAAAATRGLYRHSR